VAGLVTSWRREVDGYRRPRRHYGTCLRFKSDMDGALKDGVSV
jgi:hypothetical protein